MYYIVTYLLGVIGYRDSIAIDQLEFKSDKYPQKLALLAHIRENIIPNEPSYEGADKITILSITKMTAIEYQQYINPLYIAHKI